MQLGGRIAHIPVSPLSKYVDRQRKWRQQEEWDEIPLQEGEDVSADRWPAPDDPGDDGWDGAAH